jgi:dUTP pyrophosphatase
MNRQVQTIEVKFLRKDMQIDLPSYGTAGSAGIDLQACIDENITLKPGEAKLIPTGISIHIKDPNLVGMIYPRSGLGHKKGLVLGNGTGVIDSDYQGELFVSSFNRSDQDILIEPKMRFAQLLLLPVIHANFKVVEGFSNESCRGDGGFGHTGS